MQKLLFKLLVLALLIVPSISLSSQTSQLTGTRWLAEKIQTDLADPSMKSAAQVITKIGHGLYETGACSINFGSGFITGAITGPYTKLRSQTSMSTISQSSCHNVGNIIGGITATAFYGTLIFAGIYILRYGAQKARTIISHQTMPHNNNDVCEPSAPAMD